MSKFLMACVLSMTLVGCSSTQKTEGQGMVSVIAQNVVRIAGTKAVSNLNINEVKNKKINIKVTGFADKFSEGYIQNLIGDVVEKNGGKLVSEQYAQLSVDVAVNAAGNDVGHSSYILGGSSRSEGTVDLTVTVRDVTSGDRLSRQQIVGHAKYSQGSFLGISGSGAFFVLNGSEWVIIKDPTYY